MKHTKKTKKKISKTITGRKFSEKTKKKMSIVKKGIKNPFFGKHHIEETKKILRKKCGHISWNKDLKGYNAGEKNSQWTGGFPKCIDCGKELKNRKAKRCVEHYRNFNRGLNHYKWTGGADTELERKRTSIEYKTWRMNIFRRDFFTCQLCDYKGRDIEAHHIKNVKDYPELIFDKNNGITLCQRCHLKIRGKEREFEKLFKDLVLEFETP